MSANRKRLNDNFLCNNYGNLSGNKRVCVGRKVNAGTLEEVDDDDTDEKIDNVSLTHDDSSINRTDDEGREHNYYNLSIAIDLPLRRAIQRCEAEYTVMTLMESNHSAVQQKNNIGEYPLHLACLVSKHSSLIMRLIDICPLAVKQKRICGRYPLHLACEGNCSDVVIMKLIVLYPTAAQHRDTFLRYPLHIACDRRRSDVVILTLISLFPEAAKERDSDSCYPLEIAIRRHLSKTVVLKLIEVYPVPVLHAACLHSHSAIVVRKILALYPTAFQDGDEEGRYPIHCAFESKSSNKVIKLLMEEDPAALSRKNKLGQTPLHLACKNGNHIMVDFMIKQSRCVINTKDCFDHTPLHVACFYGSTNGIVLEKLLQHPDVDVNATNTSNDTPLHIAVKMSNLFLIPKLLDHPNILIDEKNCHGQTPMDVVRHIIKEIKKYYPEYAQQCLPQFIKTKQLLRDFTIKQRLQAYEYFYNMFMNSS